MGSGGAHGQADRTLASRLNCKRETSLGPNGSGSFSLKLEAMRPRFENHGWSSIVVLVMLMVVIVAAPVMVLLLPIIAVVAVITGYVAWLEFRGQHKVNRPTAGVV